VNQQAAQAALRHDGNWRKSSRSGQTNSCVEVSDSLPGWVGVRDSKNPNVEPLAFHPAAWARFLNGPASR
jgi:hypothetical protein